MLDLRSGFKPGALGEIADFRPCVLPRATAARRLMPSRSNLSIARSTVRRLPGILLATKADRLQARRRAPCGYSPSPHSCRAECPSASIVSAAIMHISASAAGEAAPTVSASNCMNWRKRPGPGFSLRNT